MEVYAAYIAETDYEIGRVVQAFKDTNRYKNTLIDLHFGRQRSQRRGDVNGAANEVAAINGINPRVKRSKAVLPIWGGPRHRRALFAAPWAWAIDRRFDGPNKSHRFSAEPRTASTVVWPGHISDPGAIRTQFTHVIDVGPTMLEAAGFAARRSRRSEARPMEGTSFAYTFDKANANAPSQHTRQYFEMFGARAEYEDGWIATTDPFSIPWLILSNKFVKDPWNDATWHLYHVTPEDDWTENTDVKDRYPEKLKHLQDLFLADAEKYHVLPLNNLPSFFNARPSAIGGRSTVVYHTGLFALNQADTPNVLNNDYSISGDVTVGAGANGVIVADGGRFGGYALWMKGGTPRFSYNFLDLGTTRWAGTAPIAPGRHRVEFSFVYDGGGAGKGGVGTLSVDGKTVDSHRIEHTIPGTLTWFEGLDVGADYSTPVDRLYQSPNAFGGTVKSVTFHSGAMKLTAAQRRQYYAQLWNAAMGIE